MVTGGAEREAGQGWNPYLGALRGSPSTAPCPLTIWGHLPPLPQVGDEEHQAAPGVHQLPAASCGGGAEVNKWHPLLPPNRDPLPPCRLFPTEQGMGL